MGSLLGLVINPLVPLYSMSKFAARGLALILRQSVAGYRDVHVCLVLPGPVDSPMFQRAANHTGPSATCHPARVRPRAPGRHHRRLRQEPRRQATAGVISHLLLVAHRLAPRLTEWAVAWWSATTLTRRVPVPDSPGALFTRFPTGVVHGGWRRGRLRRRFGERLGAALAPRRG